MKIDDRMTKECLRKLTCLQTNGNDDGATFDFNQWCDDDEEDHIKIQSRAHAVLSKCVTMQLNDELAEDDHDDEEHMGEA